MWFTTSRLNSTARPLHVHAAATLHAGRRNLPEVPGFEAAASAQYQQPAPFMQATTEPPSRPTTSMVGSIATTGNDGTSREDASMVGTDAEAGAVPMADEEAMAMEDEEAGEEDEEAGEDEDVASVADVMSLDLEREAEGGSWVSAPARYLQGLLWVVQMYVRGECPDYR